MPRRSRQDFPLPRLPAEYAELVRPYGEMFRDVVLRLARELATGKEPPPALDNLAAAVRDALEAHEKRCWGYLQHPLLVRRGLELAVFYYEERAFDGSCGLSERGANLIATGRDLVATSFDEYDRYDHLLLIW